jgi:hypothetical protein
MSGIRCGSFDERSRSILFRTPRAEVQKVNLCRGRVGMSFVSCSAHERPFSGLNRLPALRDGGNGVPAANASVHQCRLVSMRALRLPGHS